MERKSLFGLTIRDLESAVLALNLPRYTADQLAGWFYKKDIREYIEMTNLSQNTRRLLAEVYSFGVSDPVQVQVSADGTKKYLYKTDKGSFVESAFIPEQNRATLCVSAQVGCKMGCRFCMTARQGFHGNLSAGEILNQVRSLPEKSLLTHIVYMGMGEPLDNLDETLKSVEVLTSTYGFGFSPKRITVSTIGLVSAVRQFLDNCESNLAISLHSPFEAERRELMPIEKTHPVKEILDVIRAERDDKQRRISFEYIVFKGLNHTRAHANELARLLNGFRCRINLIKYHSLPGSNLQTPNDEDVLEFQKLLANKGIITTIRKSRGQDIDAACGLLSTKKMIGNPL